MDTSVEPRTAQAADPHERDSGLPVALTLPKGILGVGVAGYLGIMAAFWLAFGGDPEAAGVLVVSSFFAAVYFGLPLVMNRTAGKHGTTAKTQSMGDFLHGDFDTLNGRVSGWSAFIQFAFLPVALAFGALAFGIILMVLS